MTEKERAAYKAFDEGKPVQYAITHLGISDSWARQLRKRWRAEHPDVPRQSWRNVIWQLHSKWLSEDEIYAETGYDIETIRAALEPQKRRSQKSGDFKRSKGLENKNAKLCRTCVYRVSDYIASGNPACNYLCVTGHMRGCSAALCDRYIKGERIPEKPFAYH